MLVVPVFYTFFDDARIAVTAALARAWRRWGEPAAAAPPEPQPAPAGD
jgi:hypothetical protein